MSHRLFISLPLAFYRDYDVELLRLPLGLELLVDHLALAPDFRGEALAIGAELRERGVPCRFHAPFRDLNPGGLDPAALALARRRLTEALEMAPRFDVKELVAHTAWDPDMYALDTGAWLDRSAAFWSSLAQPAAAAGARIALENVFDRGPEPLCELLRRLPAERFGANFDLGHWHAYSLSPLTEWFSALGERLLSLHVHDNGGRFDDHAALGAGSIPWREACMAIRGQSRSLDWTLENRSVEDVHASVRYLAEVSGISEFAGLAEHLEKPRSTPPRP